MPVVYVMTMFVLIIVKRERFLEDKQKNQPLLPDNYKPLETGIVGLFVYPVTGLSHGHKWTHTQKK